MRCARSKIPDREGNLRIALEMTQQEAEALMEIFYHVGGDPDGPRGVVQEIITRFREKGIKEPTMERQAEYTGGGIQCPDHFAEGPEMIDDEPDEPPKEQLAL